MKALTRIPIFSYNTIATTLVTDSKSLEIKFRNKFITLESLFEFESILAWASAHVEVQSLFITVYGDYFLQGIDPLELKQMPPEKLKKILTKLSTISQSLFCLPQTVVMDLKLGAKGVGLELALAADIRICKPEAKFSLDHLSTGLTPTCGLFSFLRPYLNQNIMRSLLLSGLEFNVQTLSKLGGHSEVEVHPTLLLRQIFAQAPVARIQAKRGLLGDNFAEEMNSKIAKEKNIFNATLTTKDYSQETFMGTAQFKEQMNPNP